MSRRKPKVDPGPTKEDIRKVYEACGEGDYPLVKKLLRFVTTDTDVEIIHISLSVFELFRSRPNIELNATHGKVAWTMMHFAAYFGHAKIIKLLLIKGAKADMKDLKGWSPVDYATREGHREVVHMLQDEEAIAAALAAIEARKKKHEESVTKAPKQKKKKKAHLMRPDSDDDDEPPEKIRQQVTRFLLIAGADPGSSDLCGRSPMDYARLVKPPKNDPQMQAEVLEAMLNTQEALERKRKLEREKSWEATTAARRDRRTATAEGGGVWGADGMRTVLSRVKTPPSTRGGGGSMRSEFRGMDGAGAKQGGVIGGGGDGYDEDADDNGDEEADEYDENDNGDFSDEAIAAREKERASKAAEKAAVRVAVRAEAKAIRLELERSVYDLAGEGSVEGLVALLRREADFKGKPSSGLVVASCSRDGGGSGTSGSGELGEPSSFSLLSMASSAEATADNSTTTAGRNSMDTDNKPTPAAIEAVAKLVNCTPYASRRTPLHAAAHRLQPKAVKLLLAWGAAVDQKDYMERTPLAAAMRDLGF